MKKYEKVYRWSRALYGVLKERSVLYLSVSVVASQQNVFPPKEGTIGDEFGTSHSPILGATSSLAKAALQSKRKFADS